MAMKLSMIQTSRDRFEDLCRYVATLNSQIDIDFHDIELIFVDQGENQKAFENLNKSIVFKYIKVNPCSLSHARNIGLLKATGEYVCFPDDDCWLEANTISAVLSKLKNSHAAGVFIRATNEEEIPLAVYPNIEVKLSKYNHYGACSITLFTQRWSNVFFDENIGVGSPFGFVSGEETDFIIETMKTCPGDYIFDPHIVIHHPVAKSTYFGGKSYMKKYGYGRGWGYVMRKHHYPFSVIIKSFLRPLCGMVLYAIKGNKVELKNSLYLLKGRLEGYFYSPQYIKHENCN